MTKKHVWQFELDFDFKKECEAFWEQHNSYQDRSQYDHC